MGPFGRLAACPREAKLDGQEGMERLSEVRKLSANQRAEAGPALAEQPSLEPAVDRLEERIGIGSEPRCSCCAVEDEVRGRANGLLRYFCRGSGKTFSCLTGTPLARLRHKERWTELGASMSKDKTVAAPAKRCGVAGGKAFRRRRRFLRATSCGLAKLSGNEALNRTAGERVHSDRHIQTVNCHRKRLTDFFLRYRGTATKYLDRYLRWRRLTVLPRIPSPGVGGAAAAGMLNVSCRLGNAN